MASPSVASYLSGKLLVRLKSLELTSKQLEQLGDDFKKDIAKMVDCAKEITEKFNNFKTVSDDEFLETAGLLDKMKNILMLVISKSSEETSAGVEGLELGAGKCGKMLQRGIREKFLLIRHYGQTEVEEINKLLQDLIKAREDASKLRTSLECFPTASHNILKRHSLEVRGWEDEMEMTDFKLSSVYSTLAQWEKELNLAQKTKESQAVPPDETVERVVVGCSDEGRKVERTKVTGESGDDNVDDDDLFTARYSDLPLASSSSCLARQELQAQSGRGDSREEKVLKSSRHSGTGTLSTLLSSRMETTLSSSRERILSKLRSEMGESSNCLTAGQEVKVLYEEGPPDRFWLRVQTPALDKMNKIIQKSFKVLTSQVREGDLVLARYPIDGKVYRAKVMMVRRCQFHIYYDVLYLDYGNSHLYLDGNDLSAWDGLLEMIQPQAHLCSFLEFPEARDCEEIFEGVMGSQAGMTMTIHQANVPPEGTFAASHSRFGQEVELLVSLATEDNMDLVKVMQSSLRKSKLQNEFSRTSQDLLHSLETLPGSHHAVPPPVHLQGDLGDLELEPPLSPVHQIVIDRAVEKVNNWSCQQVESVEEDGDADEGRG